MITPKLVMTEVATMVGQPVENIDSESKLVEIITDSIDLVEVVLGLQERFDVRLTQEDLRDVNTFAELSALVISRTTEGNSRTCVYQKLDSTRNWSD